MTREERLAAKLRENLRRRKSQAKALSSGTNANTDADMGESDQDSLPKDAPKS